MRSPEWRRLVAEHLRMTRIAGGPSRSGTTTTAPSAGIGGCTNVLQVGVLRAGVWTARGLRVPARNALLAGIVPSETDGRAYGFERAMDNLGVIVGPLLAIVLVGAFGTRWAIGLSVVPDCSPRWRSSTRPPHPGRPANNSDSRSAFASGRCFAVHLGRLMLGISAFEIGNCAATLLILLAQSCSIQAAVITVRRNSRSCCTSGTTSLPRS